MAADFTNLQKQIDALTTQVTNTEGVEASAALLLQNQATAIQTAVTAALTADNSADDASIAAANAAIQGVAARFQASADALGAAVAANPGA